MTAETPFASVSQTTVLEQLTNWAHCGGCPGGVAGIRDRVVADYLRHHLVLHSCGESYDGTVPVHIHRLRIVLRRQLGGVSDWFSGRRSWPFRPIGDDCDTDSRSEEVDKRCFTILEHLSEVVHCGGGYYLPTPLRAVTFASGKTILIGGLSTHMIQRQCGLDVTWAGFGRCLAAPADSPAAIPCQSAVRWLNVSGASLEKWTDDLLRRAKTGLRGAGSASEVMGFEVYDPRGPGQQHRRWTAAGLWRKGKPVPDDLSLCRTQERPRNFWLARLSRKSTGLSFSSLCDVPAEDSRRLMYGLDQRAGRPVEVRTRRNDEGSSRVVSLGSWPTVELLRVLFALGYRRENPKRDGSVLPLTFEVADRWWSDVCDAIETLGMKVIDEKDNL